MLFGSYECQSNALLLATTGEVIVQKRREDTFFEHKVELAKNVGVAFGLIFLEETITD